MSEPGPPPAHGTRARTVRRLTGLLVPGPLVTGLAVVGLVLGAAGPSAAQTLTGPVQATGQPTAPGAADGVSPERPPRHAVTLAPGVRWEGLDDALASASRYGARTENVAVGYRFRGEEWRIGLAGSWTAPRLTPAGLDDPASYEAARFVTVDSWFVRRVWHSADGRWRAFAGPAAAVEVGLRRHEYGVRESYRYDNAFVGLEAAGLLEWASPDGVRITERIMAPVAGLAVRTGYTILASEGPVVSLDLPPTFLLFRHRLELRVPLRGRLALGAFHEGSLLRHRSPLVLAQAWHRLGLAFELAWGGP